MFTYQMIEFVLLSGLLPFFFSSREGSGQCHIYLTYECHVPVLPRAYVQSPSIFSSVSSLGHAMPFLPVSSFQGCFLFNAS